MVRRKKGSNRRAKAVKLLAKAHQHIRNQRRNFHHRQAATLVQAYDVIYHEYLRVDNMVQNHHLAKSISDAAGRCFWPSSLSRLKVPGSECKRSTPRSPARHVPVAA
jgi:putative transposase